jgi:hypothetical protein
MKPVFTLVYLCILVSFSFAQTTGGISGTVKNEQEKVIPSATVSLLRAVDSALTKLAVTDKAGQYEFTGIKDGRYIVAVSSVGFQQAYSQPFNYLSTQRTQLPPVLVKEEIKSLTGVVVQSKVPFVETKLDKTVVNVEASPTNAGTTALDVLEKSPGIMVNSDGVISLRGKQGVIIMIDGKQTFLSPTDLASMLRNMPASALEQIEIMTNPSSKFDAAGNSGIINIKTKKGKMAGLNGSIMLGATSSIYKPGKATYYIPKSQNSINFNYRKNKFNFFGNFNPNYFRGQNTMKFDGRFLDDDKNITGYNITKTRFKFSGYNQTLKLGVDWNASKKNTFGIVVSGFSFDGHPQPLTVTDLIDVERQLENRLISTTDNDISFKNASLNLNWKHTFDTSGRELTADADWLTYSNVSDMLLTTNYYSGDFQHTGVSFLRGHLPSNINIYTFKSDYVQPFKGGKLEAGIKLSYVKNNNEVNYERMFEHEWVVDDIRSNHFIYDENINAAYINYNKQIKKWTFQAGLRVENTIAKGNQVVSRTVFKRDTTNLFPTAYTKYDLDKKNGLTVSYGRRITRPNYQDLNPFVYFLDTLSYRQGNIYLKPQYTNNIELSHSFMGKFITTVNFNQTNDVISRIIKPEPNSKIRYLTVDNVATFRNMGLSITAPITITKWWNTNIFTNIFNNQYKGVYDTIDIDMSFTSFTVNVTNNFTLGKGFSAEINGFYRHKGIDQLSQMDPIYQISFGGQKTIIKGKGTVRLNVRDPFAWQKFEGTNKYGLIDSDFSIRPDIRQVTATFTYRFGKNGQQAPPRRRGVSSQDEQNRVGQGQ